MPQIATLMSFISFLGSFVALPVFSTIRFFAVKLLKNMADNFLERSVTDKDQAGFSRGTVRPPKML
jgi:hypothetical protein